MTKWGIICPGPSLALRETKERIVQDPLDYRVAVNGAIIEGLAFDYWAVSDMEVFETCAKKVNKPFPIIWCPERWRGYIHDPAFPAADFFCFSHECFPTAADTPLTSMTHLPVEGVHWRETTFFIAIFLAIARGADIIFLYGVDHAGKGYFKKGLENYRAIHTDQRWHQERAEMELIIKKAGDSGIVIANRSLPINSKGEETCQK